MVDKSGTASVPTIRVQGVQGVQVGNIASQKASPKKNNSPLDQLTSINKADYGSIGGILTHQHRSDSIHNLSPAELKLCSEISVPNRIKSWESGLMMVYLLLPSSDQLKSKSIRSIVNEALLSAWLIRGVQCGASAALKCLACCLLAYVTLNMVSRKLIKNFIPPSLLPKSVANFARVYGSGPLVKNALYPQANTKFSIENVLANPRLELDSVVSLESDFESGFDSSSLFGSESVWGIKLKAEAELLRTGKSYNRAFECFNPKHVNDRDVFKLFKNLFSELFSELLTAYPTSIDGKVGEKPKGEIVHQIKNKLFESVQQVKPAEAKRYLDDLFFELGEDEKDSKQSLQSFHSTHDVQCFQHIKDQAQAMLKNIFEFRIFRNLAVFGDRAIRRGDNPHFTQFETGYIKRWLNELLCLPKALGLVDLSSNVLYQKTGNDIASGKMGQQMLKELLTYAPRPENKPIASFSLPAQIVEGNKSINIAKQHGIDIKGLEKLPKYGGGIFVSNHDFATFFNSYVLSILKMAVGRVVYSAIDSNLMDAPRFTDFLEKFNNFEGTREKFIDFLLNDNLTFAYPGGAKEATREFDQRSEIMWDKANGFVISAAVTGRPIYPLLCQGSDISMANKEPGLQKVWINLINFAGAPAVAKVMLGFIFPSPVNPPQADVIIGDPLELPPMPLNDVSYNSPEFRGLIQELRIQASEYSQKILGETQHEVVQHSDPSKVDVENPNFWPMYFRA